MLKRQAWYASARERARVEWERVEAERLGDEAEWLVFGRGGCVTITEQLGGETRRFALRPGDTLLVEHGEDVDAGVDVAGFHGAGDEILARIPRGRVARVRRVGFVKGATFDDVVDEVTGLSSPTILPTPDGQEPTLVLEPAPDDPGGEPFTVVAALAPGRYALLADGDRVQRGDRIAALRDAVRTDRYDCIWRSGRSALEEYLHARPRRDAAFCAPCDGFARIDARRRWLRVEGLDGRVAGGTSLRGQRPGVTDGERVFPGQPLTHGERDHHALLRALGREAFAEHLADELAMLFSRVSPSPSASDLALVVRAMLSRVRVLDPGDTPLALDEVVPRDAVESANATALARGVRPARYESVLSGIRELADPPIELAPLSRPARS